MPQRYGGLGGFTQPVFPNEFNTQRSGNVPKPPPSLTLCLGVGLRPWRVADVLPKSRLLAALDALLPGFAKRGKQTHFQPSANSVPVFN